MIWKIAFFVSLFFFVRGYEYCANETGICMGNVKRHIMCYKEQITPRSEYKRHYPMTDLLREWILYYHNYYRNELACGKAEGKDGLLPKAAHMRELAWDYELEFIASKHAERCNMMHDQCRNSHRIPISGQNLAYHRTARTPRTPLTQAYKSITMWFEEVKDTPLSIVKDFVKLEDVKIGHFTVMSNDRVGRVGCSLTFCTAFPDSEEPLYTYTHITCNYDFTNVPGYNVYTFGDNLNCSAFDTERSTNFTCLCGKTF